VALTLVNFAKGSLITDYRLLFKTARLSGPGRSAPPPWGYTPGYAAWAPCPSRLDHKLTPAAATDQSPAYISAVTEHLPKAVHVFDHFHIIKLYNEMLSDLRRKLYHELSDRMHQQVLKGTRWLLLKNPENLDQTRDEQQRLAAALELNQPLALAYYMKEDLRQIWQQPDKATAARVLQDWIDRAERSGIHLLYKFSKTLAIHRRGILAYYDYPISTGPLEGANNKIKTMKRQAYGFRDHEFFKLKILGSAPFMVDIYLGGHDLSH
jgi:transposase